MIEFSSGTIVKSAQSLEEGFRLHANNHIEALVNKDKILKLFFDFVDNEKDDIFFLFLEIPCSYEDEIKFKDKTKLHYDVYYLDGINGKEVKHIFNSFKDLFTNEGIFQFGIGSRYAEIGKYKYNMINLFCKDRDLDKYKGLFEENDILENDKLITPWDTFDENNPGDSFTYTDTEGRNYKTLIHYLVKLGLYKA